MTRFAHAVREELWSRGRLLESRLAHGEAVDHIATDARDDALVARAEAELARLRAAMPEDALVRLVAEASTEGTSATMTVRIGALSIVTDPEHAREDIALLRNVWTAATPVAALTPDGSKSGNLRCRTPDLPLVWLNGTAAILFHEAHGHPLEHNHAPLTIPPWLTVEIPMTLRRATFRDVPLLRMQHVAVRQIHAPFALPDERIEIHLVDGGLYEPLTETVTIHVAASSIGPFDIVEPRERFVFAGAYGEPLRYPGVICSREGQELVVGSSAPVIVTELR